MNALKRKSKNKKAKLNTNLEFCSIKILAPYFAPPCESHFAQTVNRTKTFHVKHFCPIGP